MSLPTPSQIDKLHHALGISRDKRVPFRNHYVCGDKDLPDMEALERLGLVYRKAMSPKITGGLPCFIVTDSGKDMAISTLPPPLAAQKGRNRYGDFLHDDCGYSFHEWLGIEKPKYRDERLWNRELNSYVYQYQMHSSKACGEWCNTKVAAKASYKVALKASKLIERRK